MKTFYSKLNFIFIISVLHTTLSYSSDSLKLDSTIRYGKLDNGLSYYIKPLENSDDKIKMDLMIKVGWHQENNDEYEFAHIVEHLGFSSGENISLNKSSQQLDEAGLGLGALNAHVWNDYTRFIADVPVNNKKAVDLVLRFFQDIIWGLHLSDNIIDLERLSIINEANISTKSLRNLHTEMEKKLLGVGGVYPEDYRNYINSIKPQAIRNFYKKWYQPEQMAVVIIGNIQNVDEMEDKIHYLFTKNRIGKPSSSTKVSPKNNEKDTQLLKSELSPAVNTAVPKPVRMRLYYKQKEENSEFKNQSLKDKIVRELFLHMLDKRYEQQLQSYNTFHEIFTDFLIPSHVLRLKIIAKDGLRKEILIQTQRTLNELKINGFSYKEFIKSKEDLIQSLKKSDTFQSTYWIEEIVNHFVYGENLPANKHQVQKRNLQELEYDEFNKIIKDFIQDKPDITIAAYSGDPALTFSEKEIRKWLKKSNKDLTLFTPSPTPKFLIHPQKVESLKEVSYQELPSEIVQTRKILLENGLTLILKPNPDNKDDSKKKIRIQAYSPFSINCLKKEEYFSAINAPAVLMNTGVKGLNKFEIKDYLNTRGFEGNIQPFIENNEAGFGGSFSCVNAETALQLIYLYFTAPEFNKHALEDWKRNTQMFGIQTESSNEDLLAKVKEIFPDDNYIPDGTAFLEGLEYIKLEKIRDNYKKMFQNPAKFTFFITGDFNANEILSLCRKYLGNVPQSSDKEFICKDQVREASLPSKPLNKIFISPQFIEAPLIKLVHTKRISNKDYNWKEGIKTELLRRIMTELLMRKLRFESMQGGVYDVSAKLEYVASHNYLQYSIDFGSLRKDAERMIMEAKQVVNFLINDTIDPALLNSYKAKLADQYSRKGMNLAKMYEYLKNEDEWIDTAQEQAYINSLTTIDIQETAKKYLIKEPHEFMMISPN